MDSSSDFLAQCFYNSLSPDAKPRKAAEDGLNEAANAPNFALAVLRLVGTPTYHEDIRRAAAVNFKNHIRRRWAPDQDSEYNPIPADEKNQIKTLIVTLMVSSSPRVQSQLSEALSLIGKHEFPRAWTSLLPELVDNLGQLALQSQGNYNYAAINGILGTANSIFKKFRYEYADNDLCIDLKYCLDIFAAPLLEIFLKTAVLIDSAAAAAGASVETLKPLFESQRLCCRIFYSLNFQGMPEFFEDHIKEWMTEFGKYLTSTDSAVPDDLRAAVCENIILYMEKGEEAFYPYLSGFAGAVGNLLFKVSEEHTRDRMAVTAIKFLTAVSTSVHHDFFGDNEVVRRICAEIVIPNARLREDDEEMFVMNYIEYVRRDMEGDDLDTRRRIACDLLKGIATKHKQQVTDIVSALIQNLMSSYDANPTENWKDKHCAMYLVVSLASKKLRGIDVLTNEIVDVENFFARVIVPELQSQDVNAYPMLKAGALKFFTMSRTQLPKDTVINLLPDLARFLGAKSNVVHSYAACCIEKLLLVKDDGVRARYTAADLGSPFIKVLMNNLFNALTVEESEENQYIMKCIMRVIGVAEISRDIADPCCIGLTSILNQVCKNPKNPIFNHYLFESVAVLVRRACDRDVSLIPDFEAMLFPCFEMILAKSVAEFFPYAFQLLAQLVELNQPPISPSYMPVFMLLLEPKLWNANSNVPALVRLLQAFLLKAPQELNQEGRLSQVLGIFAQLISSPSTEERGFHLLNSVIENLEFPIIAPYMRHIWAVLFARLQKKETVRFTKSLVIFMSLFLIKHGPANLIDTMNSVQEEADIFKDILNKFWIPKLKLITGHIEVKLVAVASCRLICESPVLLDPAAPRPWGKMLDGIVTLLSKPEEHRVEEEPEMPDVAENVGYTATFVNLYNAGKQEEDPLKCIKDPKQFLAASLSKLSAASPGRFPQIINQNLDAANQSAVMQLCRTYNCPVV